MTLHNPEQRRTSDAEGCRTAAALNPVITPVDGMEGGNG